ncbi:peptidyl-tRNA hydrolase [Streptomyces diacarni]|uniref:Peptidyl-tRNA hydrolase n=1 Tax=Streptomyces diacarni TaxID=2800381 RepID=A0A367F6V8_9ACTN|nr:peptidyl-tRNA hydrolase [Streptomyces diacarni]RCG25592.1 peptidyl-tRNA hydrolase [Streptomyces diacarni]
MTDSPSSTAPEPAASCEQPGAGPDRYVLPLVVRIERTDPPARTDALQTAARAVLALLSDPRTVEETGAWHARVRRWEDLQIRKVVRRARGAEWRRTEPLGGLTVTGDRAEVRVFPPVPLDGWPKELARLQVSGTDLAETGPLPAPDAGTPVLWLNPGLEMSAGKAMAQAGHGAQLAWWRLDPAARAAWREAGFPLAVRPARDSAHWHDLTTGGLPVVQDAGFTEIAPGKTVAVEGGSRWGPLPREARQ